MIPLQDDVRSRTFPIMNWLLIGANILVFFFMLSLGKHAKNLVTVFGIVPVRFLTRFGVFQLMTLFTAMFLHGGWAHIFSNMLALYIFGDNVEDRMGSGRYLLFYLLCGIAAAALHIYFNPNSTLPTIGASGAISGVLGAYLVLYPRARVMTLIPILFIPWFVDIPAVFYIGGWFFSQLLNGLLSIVGSTQTLGGIAWWEHIGGFLCGMLLVRLFTARRYYRQLYTDELRPW